MSEYEDVIQINFSEVLPNICDYNSHSSLLAISLSSNPVTEDAGCPSNYDVKHEI